MKTESVRFRNPLLYVALVGCALCFAPAPAAAQEQRADTASAERRTPIDAWITRPHEIDLSIEQVERVDELKTEYLAEFDKLGGHTEMAVVMQALGLERKFRERVRSLLTPEQQRVFDENVRSGGSGDTGANAHPLQAAPALIELSAEDRLLDADFEEVYRLGSLDGGGWDMFGTIAGLGFDGAGNLYILDTQAMRISVVDSQGNLVRQFIGEGDGPGEFRNDFAKGLRLAVMGDGRVAVYDPGRVGFALFGSGGDFQRTIPLGGDRSRRPILGDILAFPGTDRVLSVTWVVYMSRPDPGPRPQFRPVLSYDLDGDEAAVDTVAMAWNPPSDRETFRPELMAAALPSGGVAYADSTAYAIKFAAPGGRVTRIVTRPFRPEAVTDRIRSEEIERRLEALLEGQQPTGDPTMQAMFQAMMKSERTAIESMEFYPELPVLLALRTGWEGSIWVRRRGEYPATEGPIDVLTAEGGYIGTFPAGSTALPEAFGPGRLVAFVEMDDLDVPYVVVKSLPEGLR